MGKKVITLVLLKIERPEVLPDNTALIHEIEASIGFGKPEAFVIGYEDVEKRVDHREWTEDEWLRVVREFLPGTRVRQVEEVVAKWRGEEGPDGSLCRAM